MTLSIRLVAAAALGLAAVPAQAQEVPAPSPSATTTDEALTPEEQKVLDRCLRLGPGQAAQSSKCSKVMTKAGKGDPAKALPTTPSDR